MPAVSIDGFSIREYTAKMRSVDVVKCWPFDESIGKNHVKAMLPPITVKKFSWWLHVLQSVDNDDDDSDVVPVNRIGMGRTKAAAVKGKPKVQKKRSIVDIFAVAPQVERVDYDDDYYDDEDDEDEDDEKVKVSHRNNVSVIRNCKSKKSNIPAKPKKTTVSKMKEVKRIIKKDDNTFKQKKEVNSNCLDLLIRKKESFDKLKVPNNFSKPSCSQHSKKCGKDLATYSPQYVLKPQKKHLVSEKKAKSLTNRKFSAKNNTMANPVYSNLEKRIERFPVENPTSGFLCKRTDAKFCSNQHNDKHATCSEHATKRGEVVSLVEEKAIKGYVMENEVTVQPGSPKQLSVECRTAGEPGLLGHSISTRDASFEFCDIFNQVAEGNGKLDLFRRGYGASHGSQYLCNPGTHHVPQQMYNNQQKDQIVGSPHNACDACERSYEQLKGSLPEVSGVRSMNSVKAYPQHLSSYENVNRKPIFLPETITRNCGGHFMQYQSFSQVSPQELVCKICSFPEWKQGESVCGEKGTEEDYAGLPLNSQGGLINLNSNGKRRLTQRPSSWGTAASSRGLTVNDITLSKCTDNLSEARAWDKRVPSTDQLKFSFPDTSTEWSPTFPVPTRLGIYEYDTGRPDVELNPQKGKDQPITPFELDRHVNNLSSHRSKQDDQAKQLETSRHPHYGNSGHVSMLVTPSKMRLMGKEFTVGRRDFHLPQDKRIWTDKQIIAENVPADTYSYNSVVTNHDQQKLTVHPVLGTLKDMVVGSPSFQINQAIGNPRGCPPRVSHQIDSVQQNCFGAIKQSPFSLCDKIANFEESFTGGYKSLSTRPYSPVPTSILHYSSQNGSSSSIDLNSSRCAVNCSFLSPDTGNNLRASCCQFSSESTPWFQDAKEKKLVDFPDLYSRSDRRQHNCNIAGNKRQIDRSLYLASEGFCSFSECPQPALENQVAPPPLGNYPPLPLQIGPRMNAGINRRHRDVMKSKAIISTPHLRDLGQNKKGKKRLLPASENCTNTTEVPTLGFGEDPYVVLTQPKSRSKAEGHFSYKQVFESGSVKGMTNSIMSGQSATSEAGPVSFNGEDILKFDSAQRFGPVKLTSGAKHVLKPCQSNDQKNFSPTQSTISFAASTAGSSTPETDKSTKIYKF